MLLRSAAARADMTRRYIATKFPRTVLGFHRHHHDSKLNKTYLRFTSPYVGSSFQRHPSQHWVYWHQHHAQHHGRPCGSLQPGVSCLHMQHENLSTAAVSYVISKVKAPASKGVRTAEQYNKPVVGTRAIRRQLPCEGT